MSSDFRLALIDLDGTLWRDGEAIDGAAEFVHRVRNLGMKPVFFTNNSSRTPSEVVDTLKGCGIDASEEEICTSAQAAAHTLVGRIEPGAMVAYVGRRGLEQAIEEAGFVPKRAIAEDLEANWVDKVQAALVGSDQDVTYRGLTLISRVAYRVGWFVLTNPDVRLPVKGGFLPGNGAVGALVAAASGTNPIITGKPDPAFIDFALERYGFSRDETVIIGDNPYTDILAGIHAKVYTIHVQSGVQFPQDKDMPEADESVPTVQNIFRQ